MEKKTKLRALCLLKILYERTDKNHPLSTAELIELMKEEYDLDIYRTTIAAETIWNRYMFDQDGSEQLFSQ